MEASGPSILINRIRMWRKTRPRRTKEIIHKKSIYIIIYICIYVYMYIAKTAAKTARI